MTPLANRVRLSSPEDGGVSCDVGGLRVGRVDLLEKTRHDGWRPRDGQAVSEALSREYGAPIDLGNKVSLISGIADALMDCIARSMMFLALAAALAGIAGAAQARPRVCSAVLAELTTRVQQDLHSGDNHILEGGGIDFREFATSIPQRCRTYAVAPLVRELRDPDDAVRLFAAEALGELGPAARAAAPDLLAALKLDKCWCVGPEDCMKPSWSSTIEIRFAMIAITGSRGDPSYYSCDYSGGVPFRPGG